MNAVTARLLIWYFYSTNEAPDGDSIAIKNALHFLIVKGLIVKNGDEHNITEKGKVLVEFWLSTPLPAIVITYQIPNRK